MKDGMVVSFGPDGVVSAMHRETVLELGFLGNQDIRRATDIRFDRDTQSWGIWPADPDPGSDAFLPPPCDAAKGFATYEGARDIEVQWLERCRLFDQEPLSESGLLILCTLRTVPA